MPRDAHYLFSVSQKSRIRILKVLSQASLGSYPKFDSAVLWSSCQESIVERGEVAIGHVSLVALNEQDIVVESLKIVGGEHSDSWSRLVRECSEDAITADSILLLGNASIDTLEFLWAEVIHTFQVLESFEDRLLLYHLQSLLI